MCLHPWALGAQRCACVKVHEERSKIIASELAVKTERMAARLKPGDVVEGVISHCQDYGAFVALGTGKNLQGVQVGCASSRSAQDFRCFQHLLCFGIKRPWADRYASLTWRSPPANTVTIQQRCKHGMCLHNLAQQCESVNMSHMYVGPPVSDARCGAGADPHQRALLGPHADAGVGRPTGHVCALQGHEHQSKARQDQPVTQGANLLLIEGITTMFSLHCCVRLVAWHLLPFTPPQVCHSALQACLCLPLRLHCLPGRVALMLLRRAAHGGGPAAGDAGCRPARGGQGADGICARRDPLLR